MVQEEASIRASHGGKLQQGIRDVLHAQREARAHLEQLGIEDLTIVQVWVWLFPSISQRHQGEVPAGARAP